MEIEFDPVKEELNKRDHGLSLSLAAALEWDLSYCVEDSRVDYGEQRFNALVPLDDRIYHVTYTDRGEVMRVISLRLAESKEYRQYVRQLYRNS